MRPLLLLLVIASSASAQDVPTQDIPTVHALPFASSGHAVELVLDGDAAGPLTVTLEAAPAWLAFEQTQAEATLVDGEPVARLAFAALREAPVGEPAEIRLVVRDVAGQEVGEKTIRVSVSAPAELSVEAPRPNPSRGQAVVPYAVPEAGRVRVSVVDLLGREIAVLVDAEESAGAHEARLPAGHLAAGVYAVRVQAGQAQRVARLTVVR